MVKMNKGQFVIFGLDKQEDKFKKGAMSLANSIRKAANGRTCGSCSFYTGISCSQFHSIITENNIKCTDTSVACRGYKETISIKETMNALDYFLRPNQAI